MAKYPPSAPFFGMPYAAGFPPQSAPPPPGPGHAFQNVPQMPPPPPHQHQVQNVSGFQQNASLPPVDFQALGLNPGQLAALWQQVQNGAAPPLPFPPPFTPQSGFAPPPPPPIPFPAGFQPPGTPSFPIPPPQSLPGISSVPQPPVVAAAAANPPAQNNRVMDIVNGDKEEGELSDEPGAQDDLGHSWARGDKRGNDMHNYGKKPTPPQWPTQRDRRSPVRSPRDRAHREDRAEPSQRQVHQDPSELKGSTVFPTFGQPSEKQGGFDRAVFEDQKRQAETFLTILHSCGYSYSDLQKCGFDPKLVQEVWTSLGLSLEQKAHHAGTRSSAMPSPLEAPAPPAEGKPLAAAPVSVIPTATSTRPPASKPQPTVGVTGTNKQNAGAGVSSPTDRAAYIARLMAAKNSKATVKTATTATTATPSPAPMTSAVASAPRQPESSPSVSVQETTKQESLPSLDPAALAAQKKEAQNELLRKKIEALKIPKKKAEEEARAKAQAVAASLSASRTSSSSGASGAAPTKTEMPVRPAHQESVFAGSTSSKDLQSTPMPAQSSGGIPGLFMTAPAPPAVSNPSQESSAAPANRGRKRPVAADFDDLQQSRAPTAFKRPFGQSQNDHEQMIIEVSDDETAGSVNDMDEADELQPPAQRPSQSQPKPGAIRNMPPLTNFPARPNFSRQGSAQSTPPAVQTPISAAKIENLRRKEEEIAALKKKLAEKERQRQAKAQSSRAPTPATPLHYQSQTPQQISSPSAPVSKELPGVQQSVASEVVPGVSTPASVAFTSAPQSPGEPDWKRRRRAEIQSGISAFDADLYSNMSRLEQLRREMEKIEAENKRRQQEKETLINELENLGIDTEGMPHEELQAKKDEIMQKKQEAQAAVASEASTDPAYASLADAAAEKAPGARDIEKAPSDSSGEQMSMSDGEIEDESDTTEAEMDMSDSDAEKDDALPIQTATETVETAASDLIKHPQVQSKSASEQEDTEDFYSPEPAAEAPRSNGELDVQNAEEHPANLEGNGDGVADDEDDYAPPESVKSDAQIFSNASSVQELVDQEPTNVMDAPMELSEPETESMKADSVEAESGDASSEAMDEGEDDYDPSDMFPEPSPSVGHTSTDGITGLSGPHSVVDSASQTPQITVVADDVGQASEGDKGGQSVPDAGDVQKQTFYTPYESPLTRFKAYRYHPQYSHSVSGGFKSLTYSHNIDAMKPVCPFETAGGICNDSACEGQHFRAMGISEDMILLQLGIVNPGRTAEDQEQWRMGLKQVLKGLREQNVRDAESVAAAITTHRREFLKDPSRVLNL